jgi:RNA polymerase sigma factor (TIGR02999 family)
VPATVCSGVPVSFTRLSAPLADSRYDVATADVFSCEPDSVREALLTKGDENTVTGLIFAWRAGDGVAGDRLFARVYTELRAIARRVHRRRDSGNGDNTMDTTALVHEVYLRLADVGELRVEDRDHFFAIAVRAARQIVSNYARQGQTLKRGGDAVLVPLDAVGIAPSVEADIPSDAVEKIATLDEALRQLEQLHPRPCRVVECRYFGGLSIPETAAALNLSEATVKRDWAVAQAWLHRALRDT